MSMLTLVAALATIRGATVTVTGLRHPPHSPIDATGLLYYPPEAQAQGITGEATIRCNIEATDHRLIDCQTVNERPGGKGFGDKAKTIVPLTAQVTDKAAATLNAAGLSVKDATYEVEVDFVLKDN